MNSITEKKCPKCGETKPISSFYKSKQRKDGYRCYCISCQKKDAKYIQDYYPEIIRGYSKKRYYKDIEKSREKSRISANKYSANNREKLREKNIVWQNNNREKFNRLQRESYARHIEENKNRNKKYKELHPEKDRQYRQNRRARKLNAGGSFTAKEWLELCEKYNHICLCCKEKKPLTIDHVIPLSKGGSNSIDNIQPLCKSCNSSKRVSSTDYRH